MTYETYRMLFYVCGIASIVFLLISIFLFFKLNVIKIVNDLTGYNAKKGSKAIKEYQNNDDETILYSTGDLNKERGRITDKISAGNQLQTTYKSNLNVGTEKLQSDYNATTILSNAELSNSNETTLLENTVKMKEHIQDLSGSNETTVLKQELIDGFEIEYEITYIHTQERIV